MATRKADILRALSADDVRAIEWILDALGEKTGGYVSAGHKISRKTRTTLAQAAAEQNALNTLQFLIERDKRNHAAGFLDSDQAGLTLAHYAARGNACDVLAWLLDHGLAQPVQPTLSDTHPMAVALHHGAADAVLLLAQRGAPLRCEFGGVATGGSYQTQEILQCVDKRVFALAFPTKSAQEGAAAVARREKMEDALRVLTEMGGALAKPLLEPNDLVEFSLDEIRRRIAGEHSALLARGDIGNIESLYPRLPELLCQAPVDLLTDVVADGFDPALLLALIRERDDAAARAVMQALPSEVVSRRADVRLLASSSTEAIEWLAEKGYSVDEAFAVTESVGGVAQAGRLKTRLDIVLSDVPVNGITFPVTPVPASKRRAVVGAVVRAIPEAERVAAAEHYLTAYATYASADPRPGIEPLLQAGANPNITHDGEPLLIALIKRRLKNACGAAEIVVAHGADPCCRDSNGRSALTCLVNEVRSSTMWLQNVESFAEEAKLAQTLMAAGASLRTCDEEVSGLVTAIFSLTWPDGHPHRFAEAVLRAAIESGVDLNRRHVSGDPPLHALLKREDTVAEPWLDLLDDHGYDWNAKDQDGQTAVDIIRKCASTYQSLGDDYARMVRQIGRLTVAHAGATVISTRPHKRSMRL